MKKNLILTVLFSFAVFCVQAQGINTTTITKVRSSFWGCSFGSSYENVEKSLKEAHLEVIPSDGDIYLKDAELGGLVFQTVGLNFSPVDGGLYKVIGFSKFTDKDQALQFYENGRAKAAEDYQNLQVYSKTEHAMRSCVSLDSDSENMFSLMLVQGKKDGNKVFYVRVSYNNNLAVKRIEEAKK